ncbi:abortive infection family protein [Saccharothrix longispora]|uniref:abortive infection family protein n=1 Tax=Saccharothrix longispora TaxID=33920 RepID=UPI0028FD577E|nr:abortive infection family protein [Saccharothrix longispora]MDU0294417.1 abortive infection family protein [Saccharothrix longispora]
MWEDDDEIVSIKGEGPPDVEELEEGLDQLDVMLGVLAAAATDEGASADSYRHVRRKLNSLLERVEVRTPFPWPSLDQWVAFAKAQYSGYKRRREHVAQMIEPVRTALQERLKEAEQGHLPDEVDELRELAEDVLEDPSAIVVELGRVRQLLRTDPSAAIGKSKNMIEATAKAVLVACGKPIEENYKKSMVKLANAAVEALGLNPNPHGDSAEAEVDRLLKQMASSVTVLRNKIGDGHATETAVNGVELRHGRLVVRTALAWCLFMLDTLRDIQEAARR